MPAIPLIRVDLPAPLSPTSAVTLPEKASRSTPFSTWTAPKLLLIPLRLSKASGLVARSLMRPRSGPVAYRHNPRGDRESGPVNDGSGLPVASELSGDAVGGASRLQLRCGTDLGRGGEAVSDDVLHVGLVDRLRVEQHRRDVLAGYRVGRLAGRQRIRTGLVTLGQLDGQVGGGSRLLLDGLVHGHALGTQQHALQALVGRV